DLDSKDVNRILKLDVDALEQFGTGFIEDLVPGMTYVYKTKKWKELESLTDELLSFIGKQVKEHQDTFDSSNIRDYTDSILLAREEAEKEEREEDVAMLSDTYVVQILSDIFFAGLDTTRMTLDWFLSFMVAYPEYQQKCQEEIDNVIGKGESPSALDRPNLCFTEACIMETMRMGSVAGIGVPHSTICDTSVCDMLTDGGRDITLSPYNATWKFQKKVAGKALRCDLDSKDVNRMLQIDQDVIEKFGSGFVEDIVPGMTYIYKTERWKDLERLIEEFTAFLRKELKEHKETFNSSNIRDYTDSIILAREEAEKEEREEDAAMLSDTYLVQILSDIFFAGLDTTRMTLDWFFCYMVAYPESQQKCQEEIDNVIGKDESPSASDRPNLCFTEACIMEAMRMGAVAGFGVPHATICDTNVAGYDIPKGTTVFINHWALHNDPNFWKDVDKFDPYRYLTKDGKMDMKPENWLPFSAGRRVCLGEPVARTELLLIASSFLKNFRFKVPPGVTHITKPRFPVAGSEIPEEYKVVVEKRNI
ncbi:hypothetical protein FSP39_014192, partial [Pinctada imbricata]